MKDVTDDKIIGLLMANLEQMVRDFYAKEISLVLSTGEEGAPGLDDIIDQISTGYVGYGGMEIVDYRTDLEQAVQGSRRADKFVEHMVSIIERWVSEHSDFLGDLINGPLAESGVAGDAMRVRKLAELLEAKQDAFPPLLLAAYALGPGWDRVFEEK